jgi:ADP-ribosyl-[dinitrogen reductase] hydrolase
VNGWCFDIGCTTKTALEDFVQKGNLQGPSEEWDSGNGSIMRLAPLVIKFHGCSDLYDKAVESSVVTHGSRLCKSACDFLAEFLEVLMDSSPEDDREDMLEYGNYEPEINKVIRWGWRDNQDIRGTGFVVQSLEAALWAFMTSNSFEETVLKAVNLGEDSDTTGAVAGQMAGAYWGFDAIPQSLVDGLARKDMIDLYLNPILLS